VKKPSQKGLPGSVVQAVDCPDPGGITHRDDNAYSSPCSCAIQQLAFRILLQEAKFSLPETGAVTPNVDDRAGKEPESMGSHEIKPPPSPTSTPKPLLFGLCPGDGPQKDLIRFAASHRMLGCSPGAKRTSEEILDHAEASCQEAKNMWKKSSVF
jgi:hypothetical protein